MGYLIPCRHVCHKPTFDTYRVQIFWSIIIYYIVQQSPATTETTPEATLLDAKVPQKYAWTWGKIKLRRSSSRTTTSRVYCRCRNLGRERILGNLTVQAYHPRVFFIYIFSSVDTQHAMRSVPQYCAQRFAMYPPITYYRTGLLILDNEYLVGNLTDSKIAETKASEPLKSLHFCVRNFWAC